MSQSQLIKDKLIAMKEKGDKYDELLINYKNLESKFQKDILSLSSKLCNLKTECLELQLNYKKNYEEFEEYKSCNSQSNTEQLQDTISRLYAENDDLKGIVYEQKNHIKLLNQEIFSNENIIEQHQKYITKLGYTNKELLNDTEKLQESIHDLNFKIIQSNEIINNLEKENSKLKDSMKENEMIKSVIDVLGISEWDIIGEEESELNSIKEDGVLTN
jgi:chromosome segregation ATPase